ncbi:Mannosyl-glycoprotein endo-beta-N-acetylglucosamidase [Psychromonas ingrahamii 37]|uniref:Mannosyl-glycoprotein endo-beta-N-acetylglucosamidase n=1 Tax=Psychromonas ingrahamii (strain DSM 17664 / CCUG 51855 / 37) TaxID=357804 RepID=A1SSS2_PSYIN|nr:glucosaminidase domain-containing protein [Psychromonas ingrahamii]ABM02537.1 Mannosyl-glycoprotein endo-beta-N-acetylglucosamidase [Psychromonas ingrahamii 37]
MKKHFYRITCVLAFAITLIISGCSTQKKPLIIPKIKTPNPIVNIKQVPEGPLEISIVSLQELDKLFDKYQYSSENWENGKWELPRITFEKVTDNWQKNSQKLPVETKKSFFFRLMAPLILMANENILGEREIVKYDSLNSPELKKVALKYRLIKNKKNRITATMRNMLLNKVDILPPSLALAQAAEESGWGTSRFAKEGNAFFGQWDFSGNGMKPKRQRKALGNYGVARFDSPLASVEGYMLNINTNNAYKKLRRVRAQLRDKNQKITGLKLVGTLNKYSERGQAYTEGLRKMIRYNKLQFIDNSYLADNRLIHLISGQE